MSLANSPAAAPAAGSPPPAPAAADASPPPAGAAAAAAPADAAAAAAPPGGSGGRPPPGAPPGVGLLLATDLPTGGGSSSSASQTGRLHSPAPRVSGLSGASPQQHRLSPARIGRRVSGTCYTAPASPALSAAASAHTASFGRARLGGSERERKRVLLTFSGGLVGACMLRWLLRRGYEVLCLVSDLGQTAGTAAAAALAERLGAVKVFVEDMKREFLTDFVLPTLQANAVYERRDPLGIALSRFAIARRQIQLAARESCTCVAHGARASSNDQCRFELTYYALNPSITVLAPMRDDDFAQIAHSRQSLMEWYQAQDLPPLPVSPLYSPGKQGFTGEWSQDWSHDDNIYESGRWGGGLDNPAVPAPSEAWSVTGDPLNCPAAADTVTIQFCDGLPVRVSDHRSDRSASDVVEMFELLNELGRKHGIGRSDVITNRVLGVKSRRVLESPAGCILHAAHKDIEEVAMDKEVMRIRDMFSPKFAELVYTGFWFSPEMEFITAAVRKSQEVIDGTVSMRLLRGQAVPVGRESQTSLFASGLTALSLDFAAPQDVEGYIRIQALRLRAHAAIIDHLRGSRGGAAGGGGGGAVRPAVGREWKQSERAGRSSYSTFWDNVAGRGGRAGTR
eukprot:TRINITY_DN56007_c0_g1_i1.p1 TRINITY_DN56007_c0_g1~~TRINITY_DN56007_c0_g1_i1.p1  ORF type:complete len:647 (+),score=182.94 TRINITY_DN56007_c0_g1_i1:74-1942(+)